MIAFFRANPGELLTLDDIVAKFEPSRGNVHTLLVQARDHGLLERKQNEDGEYFYCAGKDLAEAAPRNVVDIDAVHQVGAAPRKNRPPTKVNIDLAAIPIASDVPLPPLVQKKPRDYRLLLDRMAAVGNSAELPLPCRSTLAKAIKAIRAEPAKKGEAPRDFEIRTDPGANTLRVWRTK